MELERVVDWCADELAVAETPDFPGARNGLQVANSGSVKRVAASVDAGLEPIRRAIADGADLILVHHGLFWGGDQPVVGPRYEVLRALFEADCALYSAHLPLDGHPQLGNNAALLDLLGFKPTGPFAIYEGFPTGALAEPGEDRAAFRARLEAAFPRLTPMEFGPETVGRLAVLSGSGASAFDEVHAAGADTFLTGELRQHHFNQAQEQGLNVYCCGHYATEVFGVQRLAAALEKEFGLPWAFHDTGCPL
jgi:dinuclear metal center YbgI/SA1388 family protein